MATRNLLRNVVLCSVLGLSLSTPLAAAPAADAGRFLERGGDPGTPWVSGGVGSDERDFMLSQYGSSYNLKLELAVTGGSYIGDVDVAISNAGGTPVLTARSRGPWFMTKLPPGSYRVKVSGYGRSFEQPVKVPARGLKTAVFQGWSAAEVSSAMRAAQQ